MMLSIRRPDVKVLNDVQKGKNSKKAAVDISKELQKLMLRLKGDYMTADGRGVKYEELKKSSLFSQYEAQASEVAHLDLHSLNESERKAFFINIYNALTIHGLVHCEKLPESILNVQQFWRTTAYNIGGHVFSLDDIEHGILRGNRPHPASKSAPFEPNDPRISLVAKSLDPRIHFALVCGAKSCPAINVYTAENLERALDGAARSFCEQEIKLYEMRKQISVSQIFQWYVGDFGNNDVQALRWTLSFLSAEKQRILKLLLFTLEEHGMVDLLYTEYDWKLNKL